jgi:hypothetical protein
MLSCEREPRGLFWPDLTEWRSPSCNVVAQLFSAGARAPLQRETKKPSACHPALRWAASGAGRSPPRSTIAIEAAMVAVTITAKEKYDGKHWFFQEIRQ